MTEKAVARRGECMLKLALIADPHIAKLIKLTSEMPLELGEFEPCVVLSNSQLHR